MSFRSVRSPVILLVVAAAIIAELAIALSPLTADARMDAGGGAGQAVPQELSAGHLLVSELVTGATSASDEFIELYNPTEADLPLEGLELVYVTASGATITRKAAWNAGAPGIPGRSHLLIANDAGIYSTVADLSYTNGLAATGGSVALRIQGASTAIDALGWGTAASTWLEGTPAPAPPAGSSLERLPGGALGSDQDTDANLVDFVVQAVPDPQNVAAPPIVASPSPTPTQTPSPTETPTALPTATETPTVSPTPSETSSPSPSPSASMTSTPTPIPTPTPSPSAAPIPIADARALPDGATATVAGVALMSSDFTDGGGCLTDGEAGIAVLLDSGSFARGDGLTATGTVDDRYAQRTLRVAGADLAVQGTAPEPSPIVTSTGSVGEESECRLVRVSGVVAGAPTSLSSGLAYELDDGSGAVRVLVAPAAGIDTGGWVAGATVSLDGVAGQRDSSGAGTAGYRVMPRDPGDVRAVEPPASPTPILSPTPSPSSSASVSPSASAGSPTPSAQPALVTIAAARAAAAGTHLRVRGVVTLGTGLVDEPTAVIQDSSAGIVLRLGDDAGTLRRGSLVEVDGVRSTKSGMATLRVDQRPLVLGSQAEPAPVRVSTAVAVESREAQLLVARGALTTAPAKSTAGNVAFTVDDGSGPLRVTLFAAAAIPTTSLAKGSWIEVDGVLGQQTTGSQPDRGYRLWPRGPGDVRVVTTASSTLGSAGASGATSRAGGHAEAGSALDGTTGAGDGPAVDGPASTALLGSGAPTSGGQAGGGGPIDLLSSGPLDRRPAAALLLVALAAVVMLSVFAWRGGAFDRLRQAVLPVLDSGAPGDGRVPGPRGD